ncbi:MAG TPA: class I SAM-dependent methyltransferase, partial [Pyrinomonadaceae bacterium]|nr:class I SAM-dependent methyltransferase [Pyrinomonadaceae bacterium]
TCGGYRMKSSDRHQDFGRSPANSRRRGQKLFDDPARFEQRAGLPEDYCRRIASAVLEIGEIESGDLIVEIGPGAGQVGQWIGAPARYVGLDLSREMLKQFKERSGDSSDSRVLVQTDANRHWPLKDGVARAVFGSRALHLLEHEHVASEVFRVAAPKGATLIIARVEREPDSMRARMAKEMHERLRRHGFEGRRAERHNPKLFDSFQRRGAAILQPITIARWKVSSSPRQSLDSWRSLTGLGGIPLAAEIQNEILAELEAWALEMFGGLDQRFESEETYVLRPLRVPPAQET